MQIGLFAFLLVAIGLGAGLCVGVIGMGAGVIMVPALTAFAGMTTQSAVGITLAMQTIPVGAYGAYEYYRKNHLKLADTLWVAVGMVSGIAIGAFVTTHVDVPLDLLKRLVGLFSAGVGVYLMFGSGSGA